MDTEANEHADPDNLPLTQEQLRAASRMPQVEVIRRTFGLTQDDEFATRYQIPLGTLRDWEQVRSVPDQTAWANLKVIVAHPVSMAEAFPKGAVHHGSSGQARG